MAKRNLIIGGFTNYGINQLKPWVLSAKEVATDDTDVVLCVGNASDETRRWLTDQKVLMVNMLDVPNVPIHVLRFLSIYDYLQKWHTFYDYVVTTDVKDVYFQTNPTREVERSCGEMGYDLLIASEGLKYKDEPWGNQNLMEAYGPYVYNLFCDNEIFNVGTFGGRAEYVKDMVFNIFTNAINRPISICDQAVFNVLINTQPFKDSVCRSNDWACELGTVMDPSKIEQFRPNLLFSEPVFEDGLVKTPNDGAWPNKMFPIVHQYDRVPELKKFVQEKYGQEDETQYFTYRT